MRAEAGKMNDFRATVSTHVSRKNRTLTFALHLDERCTDNVTRVVMPHRSAANVEVALQRYGFELTKRRLHVSPGEKRRQAVGTLAEKSALVHVMLEVRGVFQHDLDHVGGRRRAVDRPAIPISNDFRQIAHVIQMTVRDDNGVELRRSNRQRNVIEGLDLVRALEESAIDEEALSVGRDEVLAAGHRARRADEGQVSHGARFQKPPHWGAGPAQTSRCNDRSNARDRRLERSRRLFLIRAVDIVDFTPHEVGSAAGGWVPMVSSRRKYSRVRARRAADATRRSRVHPSDVGGGDALEREAVPYAFINDAAEFLSEGDASIAGREWRELRQLFRDLASAGNELVA